MLADLGVALQGNSSRREGAFTLYRRTTRPGSCASGAAGVLRRLGRRAVDLHVLQARPARHARRQARPHRLQRRRPAGRGPHPRRHGEDLPKGIGPAIDRVTLRRRTLVENGKATQILIPVAHTPVRVELNISPTFRANAYDPRDLGAQVSFQFVPAKGK